jgi:hypothetical protein
MIYNRPKCENDQEVLDLVHVGHCMASIAAQLPPPWDETVTKIDPDTMRGNCLLPSKQRTPPSLVDRKTENINDQQSAIKVELPPHHHLA